MALDSHAIVAKDMANNRDTVVRPLFPPLFPPASKGDISPFNCWGMRRMDTIQSQLNKAKNFGEWLHLVTNAAELTVVRREALALAIFQQSLDVNDGIIILLESNMPGPAWALARPLFESYVRGLWLLKYASDNEIDKFIKGKCPLFPELIRAIGDAPETGGTWIKVNAENLTDLHDLTHGGSEHYRRRAAAGEIRPNYPDEELSNLVTFGVELRIRVGVELLTLMNNEPAMERLNAIASELRNDKP